jgi:hypothetical protein
LFEEKLTVFVAKDEIQAYKQKLEFGKALCSAISW